MLLALAFGACHSSREQADAPAAEANRNGAAISHAPRPSCVNLNRATVAELAQLPGIGDVMSRRIVEYRERHGPFRRPAEVIILEGFSEKKYRALAALICVE